MTREALCWSYFTELSLDFLGFDDTVSIQHGPALLGLGASMLDDDKDAYCQSDPPAGIMHGLLRTSISN